MQMEEITYITQGIEILEKLQGHIEPKKAIINVRRNGRIGKLTVDHVVFDGYQPITTALFFVAHNDKITGAIFPK